MVAIVTKRQGALTPGQGPERTKKKKIYERSKKLTSTGLQNRNSTNPIDNCAWVAGPQIKLSNSNMLRTFHGGVGGHGEIWRIRLP
jgi:hypothetical protein